ncbi:MAG: hypothetical protein JF623_01255 [Acidobacteria bacterium]|jgi:hypothetical protein|nr:hypothetical protein [Acidobacteriota bacterium]
MTVSPPIRIAAIVGLAAALGLGGLFMLAGHKSSTPTVAAPVHIVHHPFGPGVKKQAAVHTATPSHPREVAKAAAPHAPVARKAPERPSAEVAALKAGLPGTLARALGRNPVVVVALTNPQAEVDGIAYAEARTGAAAAGVGFVALNVLSQADIGRLTEHFGQVLPDPAILVYRRPATLVVRIDGFVDKDTVAQAAHNATVGG